MTIDLSISLIKESVKFSVLIAAIIGTIYFYKYKHTPLKYFLYLLWYITITEFFSLYTNENEVLIYIDKSGQKYNLWMFNLLEIITFITLFYIYFRSIKNLNYKFWIKIFIISYIIISIINWSVLQNFILEWSELPYIIGSFFTIGAIVFYFIELLRSEKIVLFHKTLLFWISIGLLLFYAGTIPFSIEMNGYALIPGIRIHKLFLIMYILAILMYLIFTFGFIWSKKE